MRKKSKYITVGSYQTLDGRTVIIDRVDGIHAFGRFVGSVDGTWWYADTGQHGLYPDDDLISKL